jgi:uncharacterized protein YacL
MSQPPAEASPPESSAPSSPGHSAPDASYTPTRRRGTALVELVRLAVVVLATAAAFELAPIVQGWLAATQGPDTVLLVLAVLGAGLGYVLGGVFGRFTVGRVDDAERSLREIPAGALFAGALGGLAGFLLSAGLVWPVVLLGPALVTLPLAVLVVLVVTATGLRVGLARGGDLLRFLGASGRLPVSIPTSGPSAKLVDTSALIDGRVLDVCRAGFLEGTLVLPRFVLYELQGLADSGDEDRRARGQRGLDMLSSLQRSSGVSLEVTERDYPELTEVDAKLVAMARDRGAGLITVDGNLGRVAEVQNVTVLNLHTLADRLRPPVLPGDVLSLRITKPGKDRGQGVGYLPDGTMVVVEGGRDHQGDKVTAEVTSILSNNNGRMLFATLAESAEPTRLVPRDATGE